MSFTTNEIQFMAFRQAFILGCMLSVGARTHDELWRKLPNVGLMLSKAWKDVTGQEGCLE